jgi:hypothetical protein
MAPHIVVLAKPMHDDMRVEILFQTEDRYLPQESVDVAQASAPGLAGLEG